MEKKQLFPPTIIWRHRKENLRKCSLSGLESRDDLHFLTYPRQPLPAMDEYVVLVMDKTAPLLSSNDRDRGLFILDATWRYAGPMGKAAEPALVKAVRRSLPDTLRTAYPRRQEDCPDPGRGLASIEALYASYYLLGRDTSGLLDNYYWKNKFLEDNFDLSCSHVSLERLVPNTCTTAFPSNAPK